MVLSMRWCNSDSVTVSATSETVVGFFSWLIFIFLWRAACNITNKLKNNMFYRLILYALFMFSLQRFRQITQAYKLLAFNNSQEMTVVSISVLSWVYFVFVFGQVWTVRNKSKTSSWNMHLFEGSSDKFEFCMQTWFSVQPWRKTKILYFSNI